MKILIKILKWTILLPFNPINEVLSYRDILRGIAIYIVLTALVCAIWFPQVLDDFQSFLGYDGR
jgi:hypothetical protein